AIHQGAFYSFKYDITKLLRFDAKNLLEVTVAKHSANQSVNEAERKADFWIFGGIFRPVFLEALPKDHIEWVEINAKADGTFDALCELGLNSSAEKVVAQILNTNGSILGTIVGEGTWGVGHGHGKENFTMMGFKFKGKIPGAKTWSPESPNLYKTVFSIYRKKILLHTITQKIGFRTVELKQRDGIYINGVKVKMKGVNRHSFRPETGRTTNKKNSIEDVLLMKDMNMNAVRMSHYPPDGHFLDVCDSLGLLVMDELAGWHGNYDTRTGSKLVKEMLEHDRNHPSIVIWSNGNEGGHNFDLDSLFGEYDMQNRPVVHPWQLFNGVETQHYREYNYGIGNYENGRDILMPTEFLHGQFDGGHGAGLEDYWEKMWHNPLSAGGFLWDFADQAVVRKDLHDSLDTDKHRGADGIIGPHNEKEGSYFAIKEIWSPVYIERTEITPEWDGKLGVENRYFFTNFKDCKFGWQLSRLPNNDLNQLQDSPLQEGDISSPNIAPSQKGFLTLKLPPDWKYNDVVYVWAKDKSGKIVFTWSFPITRPNEVLKKNLKRYQNLQKPQITQQDSFFVVSVKDLNIVFNNSTGTISSVKNEKGNIAFTNGPIIQEGANNFKNFTHHFDDSNRLVIESSFDKKDGYNTLQWTIFPSGIVKMEVHYFPASYFTSVVGVNFSFPESEIKSIDYLGNGPYRVWKNRLKGNRFGWWKKDYNNTETGESPWKYPEFKGYYSNVYWCRLYTNTQSFSVYTETEDVFLRLFTPAWKTDQWHNYEPIFPSGDISFMQGISSIGTKTQRNETTGPMGMKNVFYDYEKEPSRALKMVLYFDFSGK
ncbi:MAG: glycoside hydrolase family 2 TIM barrel-domain containing protein, partial [Bacteroidota bacterium]